MAEHDGSLMDRLDAALHELGMLGSVTNARRQYLEELSKRSRLLQKNSRYVTNVSFGLRIKPACANNRAKPYNLNRPHREERPRTRSENADAPPVGLNVVPIIENVVDMALDFAKAQPLILKKSKSLENVRIENDNASQPSHEMEFVSSRIQKLKMQD